MCKGDRGDQERTLNIFLGGLPVAAAARWNGVPVWTLQGMSQEGTDPFGDILTDDVFQLASLVGSFARGESEGLRKQAFS